MGEADRGPSSSTDDSTEAAKAAKAAGKEVRRAALLRLLIFLGALTAVVVMLVIFRRIFLPLILGFTVAYLFHPVVSWFERRGRSRLTGIVVLALLLALLITGFFLYVIPQVGDQVQRLAERLPEYEQRIEAQLMPWLERLQAQYPEQLAELQQRSVQAARENLPELASQLGRWVGKAFTNVLSGFLFLLTLIFVPVFAFYLLMDFPTLQARAEELIPRPYRETVLTWVGDVDQALSSFVRGQLTIALILGTLNAIGLMILGVPLGLVIGLVSGLANMIPYMSIVVGLAPALLLAWVEHQNVWYLVGVAAVYSGTQMLEGTVLSPRILGQSVNLHPVWVLLAIIVGGSFFGFFGMLIAVPVAAVLQVFLRHGLAWYKQSIIYQGEGQLADAELEGRQ